MSQTKSPRSVHNPPLQCAYMIVSVEGRAQLRARAEELRRDRAVSPLAAISCGVQWLDGFKSANDDLNVLFAYELLALVTRIVYESDLTGAFEFVHLFLNDKPSYAGPLHDVDDRLGFGDILRAHVSLLGLHQG